MSDIGLLSCEKCKKILAQGTEDKVKAARIEVLNELIGWHKKRIVLMEDIPITPNEDTERRDRFIRSHKLAIAQCEYLFTHDNLPLGG
jgi:hypothetical protein